jgi:hypothetical protein
MATLLQALLRNESGGRNIPNVHQGTSSGQAQGYFQITTGTWNEFGGNKYAPDPLHATYEQQADIASRIPLKRWDKSTLAVMRATGRPIDPNRTLGENLAMHGESFAGGARDSGSPAAAATRYDPRQDTPSTAQPVGSKLPGPPPAATGTPLTPEQATGQPAAAPLPAFPTAVASNRKTLSDIIGGAVANMGPSPEMTGMGRAPQAPQTQMTSLPAMATVDPQQAEMRRQRLAMMMQRLNQGSLV